MLSLFIQNFDKIKFHTKKILKKKWISNHKITFCDLLGET